MECYSLLHGFWPPLLCQVNLQPGAQGLLLQCWWTDFQSLIPCLTVEKLLPRHLRPCVPVSRPCQPRVLRSQDPRHPRCHQAQADRTCQEWEKHPQGKIVKVISFFFKERTPSLLIQQTGIVKIYKKFSGSLLFLSYSFKLVCHQSWSTLVCLQISTWF